jgi:hypothetical protein
MLTMARGYPTAEQVALAIVRMPGVMSVRVGPGDDIVALVLCKGRSLPPAHRTH